MSQALRASDGERGFAAFLTRSGSLFTQLVGAENTAPAAALLQLAGLLGTDAALSLFTASVGASSGGNPNPAALGTADSSEERADPQA